MLTICTIGNGTCYFQTNVASFENVTSVYNKIVAKLGVPTVLVANAGVLRGKTLLDHSEDDVRSTFDVNVLGVLFCIKAFLPSMIAANKGHVLVTSSVTAYSTAANVVCYSASKAALNSVVEGLHTELKHKHGNPSVKVSTVLPAVVNTKLSEVLEPCVNGFMMPPLEPACVAERMLQVLSEGERYSRNLLMSWQKGSRIYHDTRSANSLAQPNRLDAGHVQRQPVASRTAILGTRPCPGHWSACHSPVVDCEQGWVGMMGFIGRPKHLLEACDVDKHSIFSKNIQRGSHATTRLV